MTHPLALRREESGHALAAALEALELHSTGSEPVLAALRRFEAQPGR